MSFSRDGLGPQRRKKSRAIGDAPSMGNVPRMHKNFTGSRGIRHYAGRIPKILQFVGLFSFVGGIIALVLWAAQYRSDEEKIVRWAGQPLPVPRPPSNAIPVPDPAELEKTVAAFLAARSPKELAPLIRGTSQRPESIVAKLERIEAEDGKLKSVRYFRSIDSRCLQLEAVLVNFHGGRNRLALLSPDEEKNWRVDFDAFDRHVSPGWQSLLAGQATEGTVRVYLARDSYYNGPYRDDKQWACFALATPDDETLMLGYAKRGSIQHRAIASAMRRSGKTGGDALQRMTLVIRHTGEGNRRQFEILRVLADDWALGNEPLESKLHDYNE